ncbi:MAG: PTS sugar transporter subunit IIA [Epulopiscium sp. Nele67-Bin005]|nr:MAG: PTS sugar transporter subunit IIA [Epulopiscium sp. Nele67-Bin005]
MITKMITLQLKNGLEARPAALFVQLASRFDSQIIVNVSEKQANAKSIMGIMSLGTIKGEEIELSVSGNDEEQAMNALADFLNSEEPALEDN